MNDECKKKSKFDYGDSVKIKRSAPKEYFPGEPGSICGMDQLTVKEEAQEFLCEIGDWVYTVELPDGSSIEVAECYLEVDPDRLSYAFYNKVILKDESLKHINLSKTVTVIDYHKIAGKTLAEKFEMKLGDYIYVVEDQYGKISLVPECLIEKKYELL